MSSREELHRLIDTIPEPAVAAAQQLLSQLQVWPPSPPPDRQEMLKTMEARRIELMQRQKPGTTAGFGGGGSYDPARGSGHSSFTYWDGDTYVTEVVRRHRGHEFAVIERIRGEEDTRLIYKHEITGPRGKHDEREIIFDIP